MSGPSAGLRLRGATLLLVLGMLQLGCGFGKDAEADGNHERLARTTRGDFVMTVPPGFRVTAPPLYDSQLTLLSEDIGASVRMYVVPLEGRGTLNDYADWWLGRLGRETLDYAELERTRKPLGGREAIQLVARYELPGSEATIQTLMTFIAEPDCYLYVTAFSSPGAFEALRPALAAASESPRRAEPLGKGHPPPSPEAAPTGGRRSE